MIIKNSLPHTTTLKLQCSKVTQCRDLSFKVHSYKHSFSSNGQCSASVHRCVSVCVRTLGSGILQIGDDIISFLLFSEPTKDHLSSRNILLGVFEVDVQGFLIPNDTLKKHKYKI